MFLIETHRDLVSCIFPYELLSEVSFVWLLTVSKHLNFCTAVSYGQCSLSLSSSTAADQHVIVARETTCKQGEQGPNRCCASIFPVLNTYLFV